MTPLPARLTEHRVVTDSGCWEWKRARTSEGYGRVRWNGRVEKVHRLTAHLVWGMELRSTAKVLHRCDNPPCFNPDHLYVGTQADNVKDMVSRGRWRNGNTPWAVCKRGHPMSDDNVKLIKGGRRCRTCARAISRAYYARRKAAEGPFWRVGRAARALDG